MASDAFFRQCVLAHGDKVQTSWIPEPYAKAGKYLKLRGEDGWCVVYVGMRLPRAAVLDLEQDHKHQREASDI